MRYHRSDVIDRAITVLDDYGLADLSMRRLAGELGVQPSALYHHVANKQTLLAAVADEILRRGRRDRRGEGWDERVIAVCVELRDAVLAYRDGAELVATVRAFGLGAQAPYDELVTALGDGGFDPELTRIAGTTLLHFVLGHAADEQTHLQAGSAGAISDSREQPSGDDFQIGLSLILDGLRTRWGQPSTGAEMVRSATS